MLYEPSKIRIANEIALKSVIGITFFKSVDKRTPKVKNNEQVVQIVITGKAFTFIAFELSADSVQKESKETTKISISNFVTCLPPKYVFNLYYDFC